MATEVKRWSVEYDHHDGRKGTVGVVTEIRKSAGFQYGNGKSGALTVDGYPFIGYDLRYCGGNLHMAMIKEYFGKGLVAATEIPE